MAEADGRSRWQKQMAEADARWQMQMADAYGRCRWQMVDGDSSCEIAVVRLLSAEMQMAEADGSLGRWQVRNGLERG
jgi:hypothetical protein